MAQRGRKTNAELLQEIEIHEHYLQLLAYEIHDGFTQYVTAALFHLQTLQDSPMRTLEESREGLHAAVGLLNLAISEARRLINGLRPPLLDDFGLKAAIDGLVAEIRSLQGPEVELSWQLRSESLPASLSHAIFRIVQECLANVRKHSKSNRVQVRIIQQRDRLNLEVQDFGVGFEIRRARPNCADWKACGFGHGLWEGA